MSMGSAGFGKMEDMEGLGLGLMDFAFSRFSDSRLSDSRSFTSPFPKTETSFCERDTSHLPTIPTIPRIPSLPLRILLVSGSDYLSSVIGYLFLLISADSALSTHLIPSATSSHFNQLAIQLTSVLPFVCIPFCIPFFIPLFLISSLILYSFISLLPLYQVSAAQLSLSPGSFLLSSFRGSFISVVGFFFPPLSLFAGRGFFPLHSFPIHFYFLSQVPFLSFFFREKSHPSSFQFPLFHWDFVPLSTRRLLFVQFIYMYCIYTTRITSFFVYYCTLLCIHVLHVFSHLTSAGAVGYSLLYYR
ncbi:hypothetical protein BDP27DRAFT_1074050 [Rhodocollybia butyracea]|uniref:Uncharacterized protein n=1 Tax=Rhodocollybia butyracea TaxID=206335 RepID=A0A9P5P4I8_9AGAR|nr:hypothetical protein BDP27DRAFT_1074050 [Rhodocollybia butyracea]